MRKFYLQVLLAILPLFPGNVAAQKNPTAIQGDINSQITANGSGAITGPILNGILNNINSNAIDQTMVPDYYGTVDRTGALDAGPAINSAVAAASHCTSGNGNSRVHLRAGTYRLGTDFVPKSCVEIFGDGKGATVLIGTSPHPIIGTSGHQLVHFKMHDLSIVDSGAHSNGTVFSFQNIQGSEIYNIETKGYSNGTLMSIAGATVTAFDDTTTLWNNSNSFFNSFHDWTAADGCAVCFLIAGAYGTTPTTVPPNSSPVPSIVSTLDEYSRINLWGVSATAWDFIKAADTIRIRQSIVLFNTNNALGVKIGDDNAAYPGNNYVNNIDADIVFSQLGSLTNVKLFEAGDWTYGNRFKIATDILPTAITPITIDSGVTQFLYSFDCGTSPYASFVTGGFYVNQFCGSFGQYIRLDNGSPTLPILGFNNDTTNGIYLQGAGQFGFTKGIFVVGETQTAASSASNAGLNVPHGTAPASPVNGDIWTTSSGLFARINGATQQYVPAAQFTNSLSADVNMSSSATFFTGPTVAQGSTGTWFASGTVVLTGNASDIVVCILWDGTTKIASADITLLATNFPFPLSLSGYLASPAGNIRISCEDVSSTNGIIKANSSGFAKDSTLSAFRIQ